MLKSLDIKSLFGTFDYNIRIPEYQELLIITGPNGYEKTTIFNIINALCKNDLLYFCELPFKSIFAEFDGFSMEILSVEANTHDANNQDIEINPRMSVKFNFKDLDGILLGSFSITPSDIDYIEDRYGFSADIENEEAESQDRLKISMEIARRQNALKFMTLLQSEKPIAKFIKSQRLYEINKDRASETVTQISGSLKSKIGHNYLEYLKQSQRIDSNFIETLMESDYEIGYEEYSRAVEALRIKMDHLADYDIRPNYALPGYRKEKASILGSFIVETNKKLASFDGLVAKLDLFSSMLRQKCFSKKKLKISHKTGLQFFSEDPIKIVPLSKLSSGEKNEIIMLYNFIFDMKEGTILMIDEPEISLHVAWQNDFLTDLQKIATLMDIRVMVATHSPQIIGGMWDKCYDLYEESHKR